VLTFKSQTSEKLITPTKQSFLKLIATLLGFLSPYIVRTKIIVQKFWIGGLDWDDILPEEITAKVMSWLGELPILTKIRVPRCLQLSGEVIPVSLYVFVDVSQDAYGAVVYMRSEYSDEKALVSFITSKLKVSPLQLTSISLKLMGAVIGN